MNSVPKPPFLDWRLDAWKVALLLLLFLVLLGWALFGDAAASGQPVGEGLFTPLFFATV